MKRIKTESLSIGDIILTTTTAAVSKTVRAATRSDISHAMIYVEEYSVIDATSEGVQARNTQRILFEDDCSVYVRRLQGGLSESQARDICNFVRAQVGVQYSVKEAARTIIGGGRDWTRKQFCSRLVAQAYASVGIILVDNPNFCSPAQLKRSSHLFAVEDATVSVTAAEAKQWDERANIPQMMRNATNAVLDGLRERNPDIQNFDDLSRYLIEHPEDDEYVCRLLETSGYLTLWRHEKEKNPWQYDLGLLNALPISEAEINEYCLSALSNEGAGPNRYIVNRGAYAQMAKEFRLRSFYLMNDLYDVLATLHRTRMDVATKWLESKGIMYAGGPTGAQRLVPHTPEWLAALAIWDPPKASMVKIAIESAGRVDICSICGDEPARDYILEEEYRPPGGVDTLRLCDDCVKIRRTMGEPLIPL